jgi:hypothetical protein
MVAHERVADAREPLPPPRPASGRARADADADDARDADEPSTRARGEREQAVGSARGEASSARSTAHLLPAVRLTAAVSDAPQPPRSRRAADGDGDDASLRPAPRGAPEAPSVAHGAEGEPFLVSPEKRLGLLPVGDLVRLRRQLSALRLQLDASHFSLQRAHAELGRQAEAAAGAAARQSSPPSTRRPGLRSTRRRYYILIHLPASANCFPMFAHCTCTCRRPKKKEKKKKKKSSAPHFKM